MNKLNIKAFGLSLGIVSAIFMILLGILGNLGIYMSVVNMMQEWHQFFDLSFIGIILGVIEAFIISFIFGAGIAYFYNLIEEGK